MELNGRVLSVLDERSGTSSKTGNSWHCVQYVLETIEQYPKKMLFEVFGEDKIQSMNIKAGEELTVFFDIDAHEYNGRWYNRIRAWKVERQIIASSNQAVQRPMVSEPFPPMPETDALLLGDEEEFPF